MEAFWLYIDGRRIRKEDVTEALKALTAEEEERLFNGSLIEKDGKEYKVLPPNWNVLFIWNYCQGILAERRNGR